MPLNLIVRSLMERPGLIRLLILVVGILVGLGVYSYGMFHTLLPEWSNIDDVANCGVSHGAPYQAVDTTTFGAGDSPLCEVGPGQWTKTPYGDAPLFFALALAFGSAMVALHRSQFLRWATSSAYGTVALFVLIFGIPMTLLGLHLNFVEGTLTLDWALHVSAYALLIGAGAGLFAWYTLVRRLRTKAPSNTL